MSAPDTATMSAPDTATANMSAPDTARAGPSLAPLLHTLQDPAAPPGELTDAHLTIVSRLSGEGGKAFSADVRKHFPQLCKVFKAHISSPNLELSNAALQALGFCTFNSANTAELSAAEMQDLLSAVNGVAVTSSDKNTRTRALWVISKQAFPPEIVQKEVSSILSTLETILTKGDVQSVVVEYEALNVIIRLMEQSPAQMAEEAVRWAKLIIPLVVHSAHKVQLRGATALEMGMPLLLQKQQEVAAVTEHLMTTKLISELQKLFSTKNETFVLKLWPLFVKLLGKTLHRSGSFINSLLQLEELGFRSGSPVVKKIAFIAWKSLIDNFALNPDILCSAKRLKLLMQPLSSIHVRTEALALTKLEVWWYLLVRLGTHLPSNFEQVCVPLIQSTLSVDPAAAFPGTPSRLPANQSLGSATPGQKAGPYPFVSPATPRINLNSSSSGMVVFPSIQLLGIEMLLHFLMGPAVLDFAKQNKLVLSLEPLQSPLISSPSFFCKHASTLISAVQDGFIAVGKEVPDCMLNVIWKDINGYVKPAIESGNKKEKQGSEILTMLLQALKNTVRSSSLPVQKILSLIDITVKELPPKVLGSPAYQVADMDLLNGTPALFLIQLLFHNNLLECCVTDERFFVILETLVGCALSGPTSPLAFSESVICVINQSSKQVANKEHLWRMWSIVVNPLTEWINQTNEVNQGDALEHNFSAVYSALLLPVSHIFPTQGFPQPSMRSLLRSWAELYRAFARCAALVATADDNVCCEELAAKVLAGLQGEAPGMFSMMEGLTHVVSVMVECINFAPYGTKYQPKTRSPQTPSDWSKKKKEEPLGKLSSLFKLLVTLLDSFHVLSPQESCWETLLSVGPSLLAALHTIISHISLPSLLATTLATFANPLAGFYEQTRLPEVPKVYSNLNNKLEKLLAEILQCLQSHCTGSYDSEMLEQLCPLLCAGFQHRSKQLRNQCAQFWNCTFAKAASLTYPEQLKSVLSQAKKKVPLLLPGFESIEMGEECSGPFSDTMENSQLDAKISGMEVKLAQKRGSMLAHVSDQKTEGKDKSSNVQVTPAKLKLEFSSSKTPSEVLLEEEKSADFVFIPPETKARVLTEHQKEVLRSKRVDIPAMYNNLDASQDTTLFSQYTQSQEDSLEVSPLIENAKEDAESKPQEENARSEGCPSGESSAPTSEGESQNSTAQLTAEEPSTGEQLETSSVEAASKESSTGNENTSNVSNSSASSDVISGTPQPVSRRQSFITLEKFSGAESRPFSPSALPPFSEPAGGAALAGKQEQGGAKAEKPAEENKKPSKPEPEPVLAAIRRLTRRQSKMELQGNKSKVLNRSEQESLASDSMESTPELCSTVEDVEHILLSQSQALHSTDADIRKVEDTIAEIERARALDMDSKENTPPDTTISPDQATGEDTQVPQVSPQQKVLRRSLRRRSETAESSSGSQDKEDGIQRRDRRKEDDKAGQKKGAQPKDDGSQKQKGVSGRTAENTSAKESRQAGRAAEERSSKGSPASRGLDGEGSRSGRRAEEPLKAEGEGQDSSLKVVERPRYHTRRCAQGLLSSIENSEAEGSAKEESTRKKKHGKVKTRSDSLEGRLKDGQPGSHSQEVSSQGNETKSPLEANKGEAEVSTAEPCGLENQGIPPTAGEVVGSASPGNPPAAQSISEEQKQSDTVLESLPSPSVPEQDGTAAQEEEKQASPGGCAPAADASSLQTPQCHSKRSKRAKKSKNCDCCFKKPKQQITSLTESRKRKTPELDEPQSPPAQTPAGDSKLCEHSDLEESFSLAPCAMSTPVHPPEEPNQGMSVDELQGSSVGMEVEPGSAECSAGQTGDFIEEIKGPAHQKEPTEQVLPEGVPGEPGESCLAMESQGQGAAAPEKDGPATPEKERTVAPEREGPAAPEEEETAAPEKEISKAPEEEGPAAPEKDGTAVPEKEITVVAEKEGPLAPEREGPAAPEKEEPGTPEKDGPSTPEKDLSVAAEQEEPAAPEKDVPAAPEQEEPAAPVKKETVAPEQEEISQNGQLEEMPEELPVGSKPEEKEISNLEGNQDDEGEAEDTTGETCVIPEKEMKEELLETDITMPENVAVEDPRVESPLKAGGDSLVLVNESPTSIQARCTWSPSASPSTSILKRGAKRSHQDDDSLSPAHKIRRVSFADPIHQAGLADDIDRRSPVVRSHSSPSSRSLKILSNIQTKHITTPTKGFLSPGSRTLKFKSSKKCLITEMAKEPLPCPVEHVYPALAGCKAPVDVILPQLTSNICARGLGQLIRAKNIKTVGDLSCLTALEIKTLPIRSPKVSNLKRALKGYHEQQVKSRVLEEMVVLEDAEKPVNDVEDKPLCADEEKLGTEPTEPAVPAASEQPPADLLSQIQALSAQLSSQDLHSYSGSQLFEMQEKLAGMSTCILRNLQSRWKSPPPDSSQ